MIRLGDLDPRTLSWKPLACIAVGVVGWCAAGYRLVLHEGGAVESGVVVVSLALIVVGVRAAMRERAERDAVDSGESGA